MSQLGFLNIAFYRFFDWQDHAECRQEFRQKCRELRLFGTIILSPEGINGFLAGEKEAIAEFQAWIHSRRGLDGLEFKESWSETIPFKKLFIKLKKEIIPLGENSVSPIEMTGARLSPEQLKAWYEQGKDFWLLDTRNDYEIEKGTFEGAKTLDLRTFRDFPEKLKSIDPTLRSKPAVMFCTGGIRCEKATAVAMKMGFTEVYQLEGGILKYFEKVGNAHYKGDCFVFDEREAVDGALRPSKGTASAS